MLLKLLLLCGHLVAAPPDPLAAVASVDLQRYVGVWHEIARYPNFFQKECASSKAQYSVAADGGIEVLNTCTKADGKQNSVLGEAQVVDKVSNAKLKVSFVPKWMRWTGVGRGDYWVVALAPDYSYAVVSEPSRKYLWILNREPKMEPETYAKVLGILKALGFDEGKLIKG